MIFDRTGKRKMSLYHTKVLLDYTGIRDFQGWDREFGNTFPLKVDIGCGKDDSLIQRAALEPAFNFIGIEYDGEMAYRLEKKIRRSGLPNVRVVYFDARFAVKDLFQPESVPFFSMQFPDPWPKRRHASRRMMAVDFVKIIWEKLLPDGEFFVATDVAEIAQLSLETVTASGCFQNCAGDKIYQEKKPFSSLTLYEQKFLKEGLPIYYLLFRKIPILQPAAVQASREKEPG
jgi:tRNA (guanine-N7-)-methyltransferase